MYGIRGEFRRFCFDRAVITFGKALEAALDAVEAKNDKQRETKRQRVLDRWLDRPLRYRTPQATKAASPKSTEPDVEQEYVMRGDGSEVGAGG